MRRAAANQKHNDEDGEALYKKTLEEARTEISRYIADNPKGRGQYHKKQWVKKLGEILQQHSGEVWSVPRIRDISTRLQYDLRGVHSEATIWKACVSINPRWLRCRRRKKMVDRTVVRADGSPYNSHVLLSHKRQTERRELYFRMLNNLTNKRKEEIHDIFGRTQGGLDFRKKLAEETKEFMLNTAKQTGEGYLNRTLHYMRTLAYIATAFGDILYEERERRERQDAMLGA